MKKLLVTFIILSLTNLTVGAECVTGYACSLSEIRQEQENATLDKQKAEKQTKEKKKSVKKDKHNIFVDGGKYNSPEYTEIFTLKGGAFIP